MKRAPNRLHGSRCGMDGETGGSAIASLGFSPFSYRLPKTKNIINGWVVRVQPKIYRRVYFEGKRKTTEREITVYRKTTSNDGNPWLLVGSRKKTPAERNTAGPGLGSKRSKGTGICGDLLLSNVQGIPSAGQRE